MAGQTYKAGDYITVSGLGANELKMIARGSVKASFPGGSFIMKKGEIIGITDLSTEIYSLTCTALEETVVISYPINGFSNLEVMLKGHPEMERVFLVSAFHQATTLLTLCSRISARISALSSQLLADYETVKRIAKNNHIPIAEIPELDEALADVLDDQADLWLAEYYQGLAKTYRLEDSKCVLSEMGVVIGHLRKAALDYTKTFLCCNELFEKRLNLESYYFNSDNIDLFTMYTELYSKLSSSDADKKNLEVSLNDIISRFNNNPNGVNSDIAARINDFVSSTKNSLSLAGKDHDNSDTLPAELVGSLSIILDYAGLDDETYASVKNHILDFKKINDKNSSDEDTTSLRKVITTEFNMLYKIIALKALKSSQEAPAAVKMFLFFGYMDEDLAGLDNAITLYDFAEALSVPAPGNVLTFYHWLKKIYDGEVMPSRDEFDMDYLSMLRKRRMQGEINDVRERELTEDAVKKVEFELNNLFINANKLTFGRISTFCPVFLKDNVYKKPEDSIVTPEKVMSSLDKLRRIDPSAFYREGIEKTGEIVNKEIFHREYLPFFILMPNMGVRGALWQEIEGMKRNTPGRMVISIFHLENIYESIIRLTADFRWEMTKRIQGSRWNDASDHSLTSDYFNYIQFYKKSHDLSTEAKERLKTALLRAKNSYKEMFIRDYISWIIFEAQGSPKLNKVSREIMFSYCPFSVEIIGSLKQNPLYQDLINRFSIKRAAILHRIEILETKFTSQGKDLPPVLIAERIYAEHHSRT